MSVSDELNREIESIGAFISASEDFPDQYRKDKDSFDKLIRLERRMDTMAREYLKSQADRVTTKINWLQYEGKRLQAADFEVYVDVDWTQEQDDLFGLFASTFDEGLGIGMFAAKVLYERPVTTPVTVGLQQTAALELAGRMSKSVTETTIGNVQRIISKGIRQGLTTEETRDSLTSYINNPVRADMIARTEAVNAYSEGTLMYGESTEAQTKTWLAVPGADDGCGLLDEKEIGVKEFFVFEDGRKLRCPAAHPRCRCGLILNWPQDIE